MYIFFCFQITQLRKGRNFYGIYRFFFLFNINGDWGNYSAIVFQLTS